MNKAALDSYGKSEWNKWHDGVFRQLCEPKYESSRILSCRMDRNGNIIWLWLRNDGLLFEFYTDDDWMLQCMMYEKFRKVKP